jgi:hypothetical protein
MTRSTRTPKRVRFEEWPCLHPHAAGIDIGARAIVVYVIMVLIWSMSADCTRLSSSSIAPACEGSYW